MLSSLARYKFYVVFVLIVVAGFSVAIVASIGYYPIAFISGHLITARRFALEYGAVNSYYRRVLETYGVKALGGSELTPSELEASAMQKIIEDILIQDGARREVGSDLDYLVQNKLNQFGSDQELAKAASDLYGFNKNDFWNLILIPQAQRDILAGRLFLKGQKIEDWLVEAEKSAKVSIFSNTLHWNGNKVEAK